MSFTAKDMEDFYTSSAKGKKMNMHYINQRGGGLGNRSNKQRVLFGLNQVGLGNMTQSLVSPVAQDIQQAKSKIRFKNHLKRSSSSNVGPQVKRRRRVNNSQKKKRKQSTKKKSKKKKTKLPKKKKKRGKKSAKKPSKKKTTKSRKTRKTKKTTKKKTKIDIFGK